MSPLAPQEITPPKTTRAIPGALDNIEQCSRTILTALSRRMI